MSIAVHIDNNVGVSGRKIHWMRAKDGSGFWCRMVIAIMGSYNMDEEYHKKHSPFEPYFQDNYVEGKGKTKEEALENMNKDMHVISESLWA